jgi:hypothetical protein
MKTLTKILFGLFVFTLGTSSSNPKGQVKKEVPKLHTYNLHLDKSILCSRDKHILKSIDSLEKKYVVLITLKNEIISIKDSIKQ